MNRRKEETADRRTGFDGIRGIGPARAEALRAMGMDSLRDLLYWMPKAYEDRDRMMPEGCRAEGAWRVDGVVSETPRTGYFHGLSRVTARLRDRTGVLDLCWFNQPWMARSLPVGQPVQLYGQVSLRGGRWQMINGTVIREGGLHPVYRRIPGVPDRTLRNLIEQAQDRLEELEPEWIPAEIRADLGFPGLWEALREVHRPTSRDALSAALRRMAGERMLLYLVHVTARNGQVMPAMPFRIQKGAEEAYWESLPFVPTAGQRRALHEIAEDLQKPRAMARLLQGDVGCGKTAVAFGAMVLTWKAGHQSSLMAPTEILARQHYESAVRILEPLGMRCALLTGEIRGKARQGILEALADGRIDALFGTHALISRDVMFRDLQTVITDEQHRFGVTQRSALQEKGNTGNALHPHVLVMSATPIPRSLALILYGDLELTVIDELPAGRRPVKTRIVPEKKRNDMYRFLREEIRQGRQAFIVCSRVEDTETEEDAPEDLKSARGLYETLREGALSGIRLGLTWGGQKPEEKAETVSGFMRGEIQVLVSTTVIEVGVNNPNATVMIVENAERFGLSQLHQLRGRVGRGQAESWCFLMSEAGEKLNILCETGDGFRIARKDLEIRGPGDLMGVRQSGAPALLWAGPDGMNGDMRLLGEISEYIRRLRRDPSRQEDLGALETCAENYFRERGETVARN